MVRIGPSPIHSNGCFATRPIHLGETIMFYEGQVTMEKTQYTNGTAQCQTINHSCRPNVMLQRVLWPEAQEKIHVVACRLILPGEELTASYTSQSFPITSCCCPACVPWKPQYHPEGFIAATVSSPVKIYYRYFMHEDEWVLDMLSREDNAWIVTDNKPRQQPRQNSNQQEDVTTCILNWKGRGVNKDSTVHTYIMLFSVCNADHDRNRAENEEIGILNLRFNASELEAISYRNDDSGEYTRVALYVQHQSIDPPPSLKVSVWGRCTLLLEESCVLEQEESSC